MKNILTMFLTSFVILTFIACGGGSSKKDSPTKEQQPVAEDKQPETGEKQPAEDGQETQKKAQKTKNSLVLIKQQLLKGNIYQSTNQTNTANRALMGTTNYLLQAGVITNRSNTTVNCSNGGTLTSSVSSSVTETTANNCIMSAQGSSVLMDGTMRISDMTQDSQGEIKSLTVTYKNFKVQTNNQTGSSGVTVNDLVAKINMIDTNTISVEYTGDMSVSNQDVTYSYSLTNYSMKVSSNTLEINGTITSNVCGANETYSVQTIEPITISQNTNLPISGKLRINKVDFIFNNNGTVTTLIDGVEHIIKDDATLVCS